MPKSWSRKKREQLDGQPHLQKPDLDNLAKALLDAFYRDRDDAHVWRFSAIEKRWAEEGCIIFP